MSPLEERLATFGYRAWPGQPLRTVETRVRLTTTHAIVTAEVVLDPGQRASALLPFGARFYLEGHRRGGRMVGTKSPWHLIAVHP